MITILMILGGIVGFIFILFLYCALVISGRCDDSK